MLRFRSRARTLAALAILAVTAVGVGCSTAPKRQELDIPVPPRANLAQGRAVVIADVRDSRLFVDSARTDRDAAPQQLATGGVEDTAVTARSFAQIRTASATPMIDLLLPEGRNAADLIREALGNGFRLAGFRVLEPGDPGAADATPISAEILRFWSWNTGSWTFTFHFEADVLVRGALAPFDPERKVEGRVTLHSAVAARPGSFLNTTTKGLENFSAQTADALSAAH